MNCVRQDRTGRPRVSPLIRHDQMNSSWLPGVPRPCEVARGDPRRCRWADPRSCFCPRGGNPRRNQSLTKTFRYDSFYQLGDLAEIVTPSWGCSGEMANELHHLHSGTGRGCARGPFPAWSSFTARGNEKCAHMQLDATEHEAAVSGLEPSGLLPCASRGDAHEWSAPTRRPVHPGEAVRARVAPGIVCTLLLIGCADNARLAATAGTGLAPALPPPTESMVPTIAVAPARGSARRRGADAGAQLCVSLRSPVASITRGGCTCCRTATCWSQKSNAQPSRPRSLRDVVMKLTQGVAGAEVPSPRSHRAAARRGWRRRRRDPDRLAVRSHVAIRHGAGWR